MEVVGQDLLSMKKLEDVWSRLSNSDAEKPFECVGEQRETLIALAKCKKQRLVNNQPLGFLAQIPNIEFDESYLRISPPRNIPNQHQEQLNSTLIKNNSTYPKQP